MSLKNIFTIDPPTLDSPGKYILIVQRGGGMFGGSSSAFAVDKIEYVESNKRIFGIRGIVGDRIIVEFSTDSSFILIDRGITRTSSLLEIEIEDRKETEANKIELDKAFPPDNQGAVAETADGRQRINTQGYL